MIKYQDRIVTAKVKAKHEVSDHLMALFDNPETYIKEFDSYTHKEQADILRHISLFESRIHKLLDVRFAEIVSSSNFTKVV